MSTLRAGRAVSGRSGAVAPLSSQPHVPSPHLPHPRPRPTRCLVLCQQQQQPHSHAARLPAPAASPAAVAVVTTTDDAATLSTDYNRRMKDAMGWESRPYEYNFSRGLYYHEILPNLFVGSQPRHKHDVWELKRDLGISHILSLQQDKDMQWWGVSPHEVAHECHIQRINLMRRPVKDFDPHSLRKVLPSAVRALHEAYSNGGRVYVHCTAGLGRAPGVVIAYMHWFRNLDLQPAYDLLTSIRPCGPKKDAIRGATFDLLSGQPLHAFDSAPPDAFAALSEEQRAVLQERVLRA